MLGAGQPSFVIHGVGIGTRPQPFLRKTVENQNAVSGPMLRSVCIVPTRGVGAATRHVAPPEPYAGERDRR